VLQCGLGLGLEQGLDIDFAVHPEQLGDIERGEHKKLLHIYLEESLWAITATRSQHD